MCPNWSRIADEIEMIAADRDLAASAEPDPREQHLLRAEGVLLRRAADTALECPADGLLVHAACEGVVVHSDGLVVWGISGEAEQRLRRLALDQGLRAHGAAVLRVVLGMPAEPAAVPATAVA